MKDSKDLDPTTTGTPSDESPQAEDATEVELEKEAAEEITPAAAEEAPAEEIAQPAQAPTAAPTSGPVPRAKAAPPETTLVVLTPEQTGRAIAPAEPQPVESPPTEQAQVHIAPNLLDLTTGRVETAAEKKEVRKRRDLDQVVHRILIVGLVISTALMLSGIALEILRHQDLPTVEPDFGQVFLRVAALRPSGFLALGLLVLLATPVLRVMGSIFAFAYERDWRFAAITFFVFMILVTSLLLGKG